MEMTDGRRLHRAEAEVVAGGRDGEAHEVAVLVDAGDERGHDDGEEVWGCRTWR